MKKNSSNLILIVLLVIIVTIGCFVTGNKKFNGYKGDKTFDGYIGIIEDYEDSYYYFEKDKLGYVDDGSHDVCKVNINIEKKYIECNNSKYSIEYYDKDILVISNFDQPYSNSNVVFLNTNGNHNQENIVQPLVFDKIKNGNLDLTNGTQIKKYIK
ncbi:MAG: hypothetical protein IJF92_01030 [Bacilli bacterium]|nr:hypothetical protein [Bacilli bacterium]